MHPEYCAVPAATADAVTLAKREGRRVIAVGTTVCRALESGVSSGWVDIFIYPGYTFKTVDAMITNFHLPESTLIMLVSALAGRERVLTAYAAAVRERYRFFSFGDAMLIT
jgi:S-adenosylmethionine:tRNA ribosyltransferase-isomerase